MKQKGLIISTIILFLIVNTSYFWEGKIGMFAIPLFLMLVVFFFILCVLLVRQLFFAAKEKLKNKQRLFTIALIIVLLGLIFLRPDGIRNFYSHQGKDLLVADREGAANCNTRLSFKENNTFLQKIVCFGIQETKGRYEFKDDTIFFKDVKYARNENSFYEFGIIRPTKFSNEKIIADLLLYKDHADTAGYVLWIIKNELTK